MPKNDQQIAVKKRLIYAEDLFEPVDVNVIVVSKGGRSGKTMAMYEQLFRKRVEMAPTIDAVHAAGACRCHECIYGIQCEDDPLCEGDPGDFWYQCVEGAEYDTESGMYHGFTSYHSADFFCANGERRADHERETGRAAG